MAFETFRQAALRLKLLDMYPDSPPTFACVGSTGQPLETLLTKKSSQGHPCVIDHCFSDRSCRQARVERMAATCAHAELYGYQQVSDHCGLEIVW